MATTKNALLIPSKAPNLPIGPVEYDQRYQDNLLNSFRLYFNQIDNFTQAVVVPLSGTTAQRPIDSVQTPISIGQFYYDTTLDRPIWYNGTVWKKADGTTV
jgi:hypothetical protein